MNKLSQLNFNSNIKTNNRDLLVTTMPQKPNVKNIGVLTCPTLVDVIGDIFNAKKILSVNNLHSYLDKKSIFHDYKSYITSNGINYDDIFIDEENIKLSKKIIEKLYKKNTIKVMNKKIFRCTCGKVDQIATKDGIIDYNTQNYKIKNGVPICTSCQTICKEYDEDVLVLPIMANKIKPVNIVPKFLEQDYSSLVKYFSNTDLQISKKRQTGIYIKLDDKEFNIDVDFIWTIFPKFLPNKEKIIVASNRNLYKMFRIDYLNTILNGQKITFIANPYIVKNKEINENHIYNDLPDPLYKKLFILYNFHWKQKNSTWDESIAAYFKRLRGTGRKQFYEMLLKYHQPKQGFTVAENLNEIFITQINLQKNIAEFQQFQRTSLEEDARTLRL